MNELKSRINILHSLDEAEVLFPPRQLPSRAEVVRLAPSPTGMPHIGTAMQAVINKALADKNGGIFILRIEDTDKARSVPGAEEALLETLQWLKTEPAESSFGGEGAYGPYTQSHRLNLYKIAADYLVKEGHAYHCFCSEHRLEALREAQTRNKTMPKYDRACRDLTTEEVADRLRGGDSSVIRMKVPADGTKVSFVDEIRGHIEFDAKDIDDSVLLKSNGFPTYHLASVVDDHFMRITTVVRGEEWISSTPKHVLLYKAFGWDTPRFLHTVLLRDEQRRKLSKRRGDTSISKFRVQGYTADGFRNFLTRTMWAHPENKNIYDMNEFSRLLVTAALPNSGPIADMKLLNFINGQYLAKLSSSELRQQFSDYLGYLLEANRSPDIEGVTTTSEEMLKMFRQLKNEIDADHSYAERILSIEPKRNQTFVDVIQNCGPMFDATYQAPPVSLLQKYDLHADNAVRIINAVEKSCLSIVDHNLWDESMRTIASEYGVKSKSVFMLARAIMVGGEKSPPLFEVLGALGPTRAERRFDQVKNKLVLL